MLLTGTNRNDLYKLDTESLPCNAYSVISCKQTQELWHKWLDHLNDRSMTLLRKGMATGIEHDEFSKKSCVACINGKQTKLPLHAEGQKRAENFLEILHADICGPFLTLSWLSTRHVFHLIDDF